MKALIASTLVLALLSAAALPAVAQDDAEEDRYSNTRKTPAMREKVYNKLSEAQEASDADNEAQALKLLSEVQRMDDLNSYEKAQMWNFYGFIYFGQEKYGQAIDAYVNLLAQENLPEAMEISTLYALAQLYFVEENYAKAVEYLNRWFDVAVNPGPEAYILLSQGLYQMKRYKEAIDPALTAIRLAQEQNKTVKENWYLLLRTYYYELNDYPKMVDVLETLVTRWPKREYWLQISGAYGELEQETKQLAAYEMAYLQGFLERSTELVTLAQLFMQANVPYRAAKILQKGVDENRIEKTASNYRLLSQAWMMSAEDEKAVPSLQQAARLSNDGELDYRLAQSYANLDRWEESARAARAALDKGGLRRPDTVRVLLGMALYNLDRYDEAKAAFRAAGRDERSSRLATQWISHIQSEQERQAQLARALASG